MTTSVLCIECKKPLPKPDNVGALGGLCGECSMSGCEIDGITGEEKALPYGNTRK